MNMKLTNKAVSLISDKGMSALEGKWTLLAKNKKGEVLGKHVGKVVKVTWPDKISFVLEKSPEGIEIEPCNHIYLEYYAPNKELMFYSEEKYYTLPFDKMTLVFPQEIATLS